jgi:hypothetical protein
MNFPVISAKVQKNIHFRKKVNAYCDYETFRWLKNPQD